MAASKSRSRSSSATKRSKSRKPTQPSGYGSGIRTFGRFLYHALILSLLSLLLLTALSSPSWYYCRPILDGQALECMPAPHQLQIQVLPTPQPKETF